MQEERVIDSQLQTVGQFTGKERKNIKSERGLLVKELALVPLT